MSSKRERTRLKILDAASELLHQHGPAQVTMADVAARSGLTRQALYLYFATRGRLMVALIQHVGRQLGARTLFDPVQATSAPFEQLERAIRAIAAYAPRMHPIARALELARHTDADAAAAWSERMEMRRTQLRGMVARCARQATLRAGWTVARVTDALWTLTAPGTYDDFVVERGNSQASYEEFLRATIGTFFGRRLRRGSNDSAAGRQ